jgi:hypothetical protein
MATEYFFREFDEAQQETLARAVQAYQAYLDAVQANQGFKGGMHWKRIAGKEYLYRYRDRQGHGDSLGPRSPHTERLFTEFRRRRRETATLLRSRHEHLATASRFCRAALLHRVPEPVSRIVRHLELSAIPGGPLIVVGTQALHAFEFAARVFIEGPKAGARWSEAAPRLALAASRPVPPDQLLRLLRQADRSFSALPGDDFQAVNKAGFPVKLVRPPALRIPTKSTCLDAGGPAVPAESGDLTYLLSAPKFSQVVIGQRGTPATMTVPDPRALALHKLWLSQQEGREPAQRHQDRLQAMALAELTLRYLPQYDFFSSQLHLFPPEVARLAQELVEGYEIEP